MQPHAWQPHDVRFGGIVPLYSRDSKKGLSYGVVSLLDKVPSGGVPRDFSQDDVPRRKYDSRWGLAARRLHGEVQDCGFFHRPLDVGLYSSWQLHPEAQDTGLPGECQPRH